MLLKNHSGSDYQALYNQLLHDLHHGIRSYNCTILGLVQSNLPDGEKVKMIALLAGKLDTLTKEISLKHNQINP
jgi:hypothetical protein